MHTPTQYIQGNRNRQSRNRLSKLSLTQGVNGNHRVSSPTSAEVRRVTSRLLASLAQYCLWTFSGFAQSPLQPEGPSDSPSLLHLYTCIHDDQNNPVFTTRYFQILTHLQMISWYNLVCLIHNKYQSPFPDMHHNYSTDPRSPVPSHTSTTCI